MKSSRRKKRQKSKGTGSVVMLGRDGGWTLWGVTSEQKLGRKDNEPEDCVEVGPGERGLGRGAQARKQS